MEGACASSALCNELSPGATGAFCCGTKLQERPKNTHPTLLPLRARPPIFPRQFMHPPQKSLPVLASWDLYAPMFARTLFVPWKIPAVQGLY